MFTKDEFLKNCKRALREGQKAIREVVLEAVADPSGIILELGEPKEAGVHPLYNSENLTVINFVWAPYMHLIPHNHNMTAVIGIYSGREDNVFWRRLDTECPGLEAAGAKSLGPGEAVIMGPDIIHSVANPLRNLTSAIHVYSGNFFEPLNPRSQWDHETLVEENWDMDHTRKVFKQADARFKAGQAMGVED